MKKLLLTAATTLLSFTVLADFENTFYAKVNVGANWMQKITDEDNTVTPCLTLTCRSKAAPIFLVGGGYNLSDKVRAELTLETVKKPTLSGSTTVNDLQYYGKHVGYVSALMLNSYIDVFNAKVAGIFAGVGLGVASVKETLSGSVTNQEGETNTFKASTKTRNNIAYQLTLGAQREITQGIIAELSYSWRDYGKSGSLKGEDNTNVKSHFKGHNIMIGLRIDI